MHRSDWWKSLSCNLSAALFLSCLFFPEVFLCLVSLFACFHSSVSAQLNFLLPPQLTVNKRWQILGFWSALIRGEWHRLIARHSSTIDNTGEIPLSEWLSFSEALWRLIFALLSLALLGDWQRFIRKFNWPLATVGRMTNNYLPVSNCNAMGEWKKSKNWKDNRKIK